ncbi:MAG: hypothetical protein RLY21_2485 [Planctomycetota bacterium]
MGARLASIFLLFGALGVAGAVLQAAAEGEAPSFNRHIRPILADNCLHCHGVDVAKRQGNLRLDDEASVLARGTVVPGNAAASPLIARIESTDPRRVMPPPDSHRSLTEAQRRTLARWIDAGAKFDAHWSFVAPVRTATPAAENPIDAIVSRRLRSEGLALSPQADRSTLLRRVTLDLTGLPPTPAEIDAFLTDTAPGAYERVVDRLLASPRYGEKMALPWLDAARYADSNGFQQDGDTFQWLWRDWLVRELNKDTPYDRLATEMLAGDLLPDATDETRLATGFNRNHLLNGEGGAIPEENRWVTLFDRVDATATTFLGLTMSCAQCHDHKFDPITQRDYYALLDAFNRVPEDGLAPGAASRIRVAEPTLAYASAEQRARRAALEQAVRDAGEGDEHKPAREAAQQALDRYRFDEWPRVMVMSDAQPRETRILVRGEYLAPGGKVEFATPAFLPPLAPDAPRSRLGLAQWLFSPENPLVARVAVNRAWQVFFGDGLVRTPEDFGVQSEVPLYQDLLDTLAVEFRESGWRTKALHRLIVTSAVYRQASEASAVLYARDPENRLLARAPRFRLPSLVLRDIALASSGLLDPSIGGAPVYPYQPDRVWEPLAITKERDFTYPASQGRELYRRSLYTFWRRTIAPANMFDTSQRQSCRVRVPVTNSPLHALVTLNDPTWVEAARVLAEQVSRERATPEARLAAAFERVVGRAPGAVERELLARMFARQHERYARDGAAAIALLSVGATPRDESFDPAEQAALASACLAILNLDEALTRG